MMMLRLTWSLHLPSNPVLNLFILLLSCLYFTAATGLDIWSANFVLWLKAGLLCSWALCTGIRSGLVDSALAWVIGAQLADVTTASCIGSCAWLIDARFGVLGSSSTKLAQLKLVWPNHLTFYYIYLTGLLCRWGETHSAHFCCSSSLSSKP